ncbi:hypothetical protein SEA_ARCHETTA_37 [Mycobacterium phage Archetta]|uniref:DUF7448 domain-containing protein n=2 Tax=Benedictvirus TaxID=2946819 RepID=V5R9M6_9CAUD|nr:hypothetical protein X823_gp56 [Mycobacterium phage Conspiracy]YP_008859062.1 hypothetical protein X816_gp54 [Mycobacterium phage Jovo]YP_010061000.1 hypothetical protein KIP52_gp45 [Mycobacterium phage Archetta]ATW60429.1 hypothetical protein SEA_FORGETIT_37 [Mycobacterium phage ForGetIt]QGJ97235.1 hypothetical protein SEA_LEV2_37 [Mycobacterium phage Lev2]WNN94269.1 hypothetical protein SEA_PICKLEBACK_37 [Mycobacterium phage PickleBack]AHB29646.1 hypothetical protein CONSPIRACY_37 [Mycob
MSYWGFTKERIIGKKVLAIYMDDQSLILETDQGTVGFGVKGDCCSWSYFYDIYGADKLLSNGPVIEVNEIDLSDQNHDQDGESIQVYGYEFVTEHPIWGEQTTVVSFRNSSNGYYGGWMYDLEYPERVDVGRLQFVTEEYHDVELVS